MYSLSDLFKNTSHDDSAFDTETVSAIESMIYTKEQRGKINPFIKCIIRKKEIRLIPEEAVRQLYVYKLIHEYGYDPENIRVEHGISFGRETKRADIVIFSREHPDAPYIIVEVKKPELTEGKEQLISYCNASGAVIGIWTNGEDAEYYYRKDPNIFESLDRIPKASETISEVLNEHWTIADLTEKDKLRDGRISLKALIQELENDVLAGAGVNAFNEVFKLIYTKLFDEMQSIRNENRFLEFKTIGGDDEEKADKMLKKKIQALFDRAKVKWPKVFEPQEQISLMPSHLAVCVARLQNVKLFNSNLDVIDDAFEYLMNRSSKSEKGQFFTPRYGIDMCVRMLNPQENESMIDTAAGSCGFPVHTIFHVWGNIYDRLGIPRRDMFTAEMKPSECIDYVREKVFAIDFDETAVKVARTLNLIAGDGRTNIMRLNTLDYGNWDEMTTLDWMQKYSVGWLKMQDFCETAGDYSSFMFDIVMANPPFAGDIQQKEIIYRYELAKDSKGKYASKIGRDILFIERNIHFLKPGGRMAIILPQGRFNNSSDKYIRDFIARECRILAVIGLHENVFKPHTGTKTSVLLVQKWDDDLCPHREDYPVFFATMRKPGKDNSGGKIYVRDSDGHILRDAHNHPVVDHDLYNHEGLTQDGIAEAFIEFAKREGLSFFGDARFSEERYGELVSGLEVSEVMLSEIITSTDYFRLEAEYFNAKELLLDNKLKGSEIISGIQYGTSRLCDENDNGYPVLRLNELDNGFIGTPKKFCHTLTDYEVETLRLKKGDVLVIRTNGNPDLVGRSAVVMEDSDCAFASYLFRVFVNGVINPFTVSAFMNGKYGRTEIDRLSMKGNQTNFSPAKFRDMIFPKIGHELQEAVQKTYEQAYIYRKEAQSLYALAQSILNDAIHFTPRNPDANTSVVSLSQVFSSGRIDAEYFMPKYDELLAHLRDNPKIGSSCNIHGANFTPRKGIQYRYIELADVGTSGNITGATVADGSELPTRARRLVHAGQVIISSIEGSLQSCALITPEYDGALCSTGFYVVDSDMYNSETLLMLFKSPMIQSLMKRGCSGTILSAISENELRKIPMPYIDSHIQQSISEHVRKSFALRKESERLIALAVKSVELAVEYDENTAINLITQEEITS